MSLLSENLDGVSPKNKDCGYDESSLVTAGLLEQVDKPGPFSISRPLPIAA